MNVGNENHKITSEYPHLLFGHFQAQREFGWNQNTNILQIPLPFVPLSMITILPRLNKIPGTRSKNRLLIPLHRSWYLMSLTMWNYAML